MQKFVLLLLMIAAMASCQTTRQAGRDDVKGAMNSWIGHHKSELIREWGPPQYYASDGKDGEILIYQRTETYAEEINGRYHERTVHPNRMFYADAYGNIYFWRIRE